MFNKWFYFLLLMLLLWLVFAYCSTSNIAHTTHQQLKQISRRVTCHVRSPYTTTVTLLKLQLKMKFTWLTNDTARIIADDTINCHQSNCFPFFNLFKIKLVPIESEFVLKCLYTATWHLTHIVEKLNICTNSICKGN